MGNTELKDGALTIVAHCFESAVFFISPLGCMSCVISEKSFVRKLSDYFC